MNNNLPPLRQPAPASGSSSPHFAASPTGSHGHHRRRTSSIATGGPGIGISSASSVASTTTTGTGSGARPGSSALSRAVMRNRLRSQMLNETSTALGAVGTENGVMEEILSEDHSMVTNADLNRIMSAVLFERGESSILAQRKSTTKEKKRMALGLNPNAPVTTLSGAQRGGANTGMGSPVNSFHIQTNRSSGTIPMGTNTGASPMVRSVSALSGGGGVGDRNSPPLQRINSGASRRSLTPSAFLSATRASIASPHDLEEDTSYAASPTRKLQQLLAESNKHYQSQEEDSSGYLKTVVRPAKGVGESGTGIQELTMVHANGEKEGRRRSSVAGGGAAAAAASSNRRNTNLTVRQRENLADRKSIASSESVIETAQKSNHGRVSTGKVNYAVLLEQQQALHDANVQNQRVYSHMIDDFVRKQQKLHERFSNIL